MRLPWDDTEVARRWLMLCPIRKSADGGAAEPTEPELNSIRLDEDKLKTIRNRLSDISWWMRLLCQRIAQKANAEEEISGKFWQSRYRAVRLIDEESILACAAYVDLNPIRAATAQTIEDSRFSAAQLRLKAIVEAALNFDQAASAIDPVLQPVDQASTQSQVPPKAPIDSFLSPIEIDELNDPLGARASLCGDRCSDKGFLPMPAAAYLELLDWTARQIVTGKRGATPEDAPPLLERLNIKPAVWFELATQFGRLFSLVAGQPHRVDAFRSRIRRKRSHLRRAARELLTA